MQLGFKDHVKSEKVAHKSYTIKICGLVNFLECEYTKWKKIAVQYLHSMIRSQVKFKRTKYYKIINSTETLKVCSKLSYFIVTQIRSLRLLKLKSVPREY